MAPSEENSIVNPLLVVVGMPGAGKSTVVAHLAKRGWPTVYFGQITLSEIRRRAMTPSPESEKEVRESLRREHGNDVYAQKSLDLIRQCLDNAPAIVDGLYSWAEYKLLRSKLVNPVIVIAVCADRELRYKRLAQRPVRPLSPVEAEERDFAEIGNIQKGGPIAMADYTILNNVSRAELEVAVDAIVSRIINTSGKGEREWIDRRDS